jgi:hypothetical protein
MKGGLTMGELIERNIALEIVRRTAGDYAAAFCEIERIPTVGAAPVVHGHWIEKPYLIGTSNFCSVCDDNFGMPHEKYNYCPTCGAVMDEEE